MGLDDVVAAETVLCRCGWSEAGRLIDPRSFDLAGAGRTVDLSRQVVRHVCCDGFFDGSDLADDRIWTVKLGEARVEVFDRLRCPRCRLLAACSQIYRRHALPVMALLAGRRDSDGRACRLDRGDHALSLTPAIAAPASAGEAAASCRTAKLWVMPPSMSCGCCKRIRRRRPATMAEATRRLSGHGGAITASTPRLSPRASSLRHRAGLTSSVLAGLGALKGPLAWRRARAGARDAGCDRLGSMAMRPAGCADADRLGAGRHHGLRPSRLPRARPARRRAEGRRAAPRQPGRNRTPAGLRREGRTDGTRGAEDLLARRKQSRPLQTNVEFYTALVLEAAGAAARQAVHAVSSPSGRVVRLGRPCASNRRRRAASSGRSPAMSAPCRAGRRDGPHAPPAKQKGRRTSPGGP